jgi:hypothetical protein
MAYYDFLCTDEIVDHLAEHEISQEELDDVTIVPVTAYEVPEPG